MNRLLALKNQQLKQICIDCGVSQTGKKSVLVERLMEAERCKLPSRLISIDMGVKNLAYCNLDIDNWRVEKWALAQLPVASYDQPNFGRIANDLVETLHLEPVVLIEQQRMRSQGLKNVPEWISRVNLLEAMIHALVQARNREITVHQAFSIPPSKVMQYWVRDTTVSTKSDSNKRYRLTKQAKVDLVDGWIKNGSAPVEIDSGIPTHGKKRDDLSDALLQGLAWVRWQQNRMLLDDALAREVEINLVGP